MAAKKSPEEILDALGGQERVRDYLRGVEPDSEADRDARGSMLAAIRMLRQHDVKDIMAAEEPELYAQAALILCRMWADTEDADASKLLAQYRDIMMTLRYDDRNFGETT